MDTFNAIGLGILLAATVIELPLILSQTRDRNLVKDVRSNLLLGILYFLADLLVKAGALGVFSICYEHALFKPTASWWLWIVGFVACDFVHYIYHWLGHKTRIFWASHVTHHSSEYLNMSHGYRINFFQSFYRFLFWAPLCLLGIPPIMVLIHDTVAAVHAFLVHTEKIGKLGVLDWIISTPSNHRVHHGKNPQYIDKNYGAVLMVFDHLFGTFQKEVEPPVYGITRQIQTHDPFKIITHEYVRVLKDVLRIKGVSKKIRYLFSPPD